MTREPVPPAQRENMPYRECAGVALFNTKGQVFVGQRIAKTGINVGTEQLLWQMPQGGIDPDEQPLDAAKRELYEETNVQTTRLIMAAPDKVFYDLPDEVLGKALRGIYRGQQQYWFALLHEGADDEIDIKTPGNGAFSPEFSNWRWEALANLPDLIVPFKKHSYQQLVDWFGHIPAQLASSRTQV